MLPPLVAKKNSVCSESRCLQPCSLLSSLRQPGARRRPLRMKPPSRPQSEGKNRPLSPVKDPARTKPGGCCCTGPRRPPMHSHGREDTLGLERLRQGVESNPVGGARRLGEGQRGTGGTASLRVVGLHKPVTPEKQSPPKLNRKGPRSCPQSAQERFPARFCRIRPRQAHWTQILSHLPWEKPVICPPQVLLWIVLKGCMPPPIPPGGPWSYSRFWRGQR